VVLGQKAARQPSGIWILTDGTLLDVDIVYQTAAAAPTPIS